MAGDGVPPVIHTYTVADVKCYMCGGIVGSIEGDRGAGTRVRFRAPGAAAEVDLEDWRRLRCRRCGGAVYLDDAQLVTRRVETFNWFDDQPRRGRPPKRLVEQRRREREAALGNRAA